MAHAFCLRRAGSGKSHLPSGIGHALIDAGKRVLFLRCSDLVQRLQAARRDPRLPQELTRLNRFGLITLDDLSCVRRDQAETLVLFELISERYERKSIAITANTPFSQWGDVFVDPAMTVAAIERLVHHATILEMNVESYRRRSAQERQAHQPRPPSHQYHALQRSKTSRNKAAGRDLDRSDELWAIQSQHTG